MTRKFMSITNDYTVNDRGTERIVIPSGTDCILRKTSDEYELISANNVFMPVGLDFINDNLVEKKLMAINEAMKTIKAVYGRFHGSFSRGEFAFNIKMNYSHEIPERVKALCSENDIDSEYYEILSRGLDCFMGVDCDMTLDYMFDWVGNECRVDWWTEGKNGGWLVIKALQMPDIDRYEELKDELEGYRERIKISKENGDHNEAHILKEELQEFTKELAELEKEIVFFAEELDFVNRLIIHDKQAINEYLSTEEAWCVILEPKLEELEEQEKLKKQEEEHQKRLEYEKKNTIENCSGLLSYKELRELIIKLDYAVVDSNYKNFMVDIKIIGEKDEH